MFLGEPGRTNYDLTFTLFGFPIRVHPAFFIMPVLLGRGLLSPNVNAGVGLVIIMAIFFVSILVHELGHAVAFRYYGIRSRIVLYWMGGLAIPENSGWGNSHSLNSNQQIVVSLAGPVFGFLLAGLLIGIVYLAGGSMYLYDGRIPIPLPDLRGTVLAKDTLLMVFAGGILINIFLNALNLAPIYPLDGGQVARHVMLQMDVRNGLKNSIFLSIGAAILITLFALSTGDRFMAFFFGFMAWSNFQLLQSYGRSSW